MELILRIGDFFELSSNLFVAIIVANWLWGFKRVTLSFSCGSISLRKRDINVQSVTNIISLKFFNGGQIPPKVRGEIIEKLTPKFK